MNDSVRIDLYASLMVNTSWLMDSMSTFLSMKPKEAAVSLKCIKNTQMLIIKLYGQKNFFGSILRFKFDF